MCPKHRKKQGKTCSTKSINADYLENAVKDAVTAYINKVICLPQYNNAITSLVEKKIKQDCSSLKKRICTLDEEAKSLLRCASKTSNELLVNSYEEQANEHLQTKVALEKQLKSLLSTNKTILEEVQQYCSGNKVFTSDTLFIDKETTKMLIHTLVKRIDVDDSSDSISITFND